MTSEPDEASADSSEVDEPSSAEPASDESQTVEQPKRSQSHEPDQFTLSRSNQAVAMGLAAIVIVLAILQWGRLSGWGLRPVEIGELPPVTNEFRLNINNATAIQWSQLDGIGEVLADRIVQDRTDRGAFETIDDLTRVEGIGPSTLEQIRPWLTVKQTD